MSQIGWSRKAKTTPDRRPPTMPEFRVYRPKDIDLLFDGELLAEVSSRESEEQDRWTEIRIYRTTSGKYVTEEIGRTTVPDEVDIWDTRVHEDPHGIVKALRRRRADGRHFFTYTTLEAFDQAIAADPSLAQVLVEKI
jgi:hypothetical protein